MDVQQAINFAIHERFEQDAIPFAFPSQTVHMQQRGDWELQTPPQPERRAHT